MTVFYLTDDRSVVRSMSFSSFQIHLRYNDDGDVVFIVVDLSSNRPYLFNIDNILKIQHD